MEKLSIKKSLRLLEKMIARFTMLGFIIFIIILMSSKSADAQTIECIDVNSFKVIESPGNYYHVDSQGVYNGPFKLKETYQDGSVLLVRGYMYNGKRCGKVVYKLDNQIVAIRQYNTEGVLVRSTRIRPNASGIKNPYLAEN
jgi:hypothetical protein